MEVQRGTLCKRKAFGEEGHLLKVSSAGQAGVHHCFKIYLITGTVPTVNKENLVCH